MDQPVTPAQRDAAKAAFLAAFAELGTVSAAAKVAGAHRKTTYDWRKADPEFADAWDAISEEVTDKLEATATSMALSGYVETKTITGDDGSVREEVHHRHDPGMLKFLLAARRRDTYGAKSELAVSGELTSKRIVFERETEDDDKENDDE